MTSADPAFKELSVGSRTQISKQAFALHVVSAMKDKVQGAGGGRCGANSRGCEPSLGSGRAGRGGGRGLGVGWGARGFAEPELAKLYPKYKKSIFIESVLNYLHANR